jgi:hypothetical protein
MAKLAAPAAAAILGSHARGAMRARRRPSAPRAAGQVSRVVSEASAAVDKCATSVCAPPAAAPVSLAALGRNVRAGKFATAERARHAEARTSRAAPAMRAPIRRKFAGTRATTE